MTDSLEPIYEEIRKLRWLMHHDVLTGLPNNLTFQRRMKDVDGGWFVLVDLDGFKDFQDHRRSHRAGDRVLCEFADFLRESTEASVRRNDESLVVRMHGDEFVVWTVVETAARRIAEQVQNWKNEDGGVTASVGVGETLDEADRDMYRDKLQKKGQRWETPVEPVEPMEPEAVKEEATPSSTPTEGSTSPQE